MNNREGSVDAHNYNTGSLTFSFCVFLKDKNEMVIG